MKFFLPLVMTLSLASCSISDFAGESLKKKIVVGPELIRSTLKLASEQLDEHGALHESSVAQVVFPKIIKGSLVFGGTYGEGYLVRDEIILGRVRLAGGNTGITAGVQTYSQVVYIMSDEALAEFRNYRRVSLHGTLNYAENGRSKTSTFGKQSLRPLHTAIFNQSGYLTGISLDGTVMEMLE